MEATVHGFLLALGLILPLGVQNIFIFNQGITQRGIRLALPAVITASICDTLLILLAVFGLSYMVMTFEWLQIVLYSLGIIFLSYMGWSIWSNNPVSLKSNDQALSPKKQILFAASVSLLNPHAIIDIFGVIGTSSLVYFGTDKWLFTFTCIGVSWIWFTGLAVTGHWIGRVDASGRVLMYMNRGASLIIWGSALYMGWNLLKIFL
ncbi:LysE/ArgO family amino acid transporter [Bacillus horti]|uniref:L-lysine exporter family protein LysE/ArgO n=1 Tax=Caldalkalibacillus horti TaxID=77523 RepID=A0ABT9W0F7_9BACI|nr:LysE family transporter [Bacillus horti]MDQ0166580.1 L-lysine exporter family protein LysE/ArgO [Bacillus horti]